MQHETIHLFGALKSIVSDNAPCLTARLLREFMERHKKEWRTALVYASMSIGKAERMVGTIKWVVDRLVNVTSKECDEVVDKVVFGYRRCLLRNDLSPFQLIYGIRSKIVPQELVG